MDSKEHIPFEYNEITDGVFVGTNQCCETHFAEELVAKGIEADISLDDERVDRPVGAKYYLWLPTRDFSAPSKGQFDEGVAALEQFVKDKIKVYVHCKLGHGRAPTLVAAYLIKSKGMGVQQAIDFIVSKRPAVHLSDEQVRALGEYKNLLTTS